MELIALEQIWMWVCCTSTEAALSQFKEFSALIMDLIVLICNYFDFLKHHFGLDTACK